MTTDLPAWADMTELDQGAALLHFHKREIEGGEYAVENYPAEYFDHEALLALSQEDASDHAAVVVREFKDGDGWCNSLEMRLYDLALDADRARMQAARDALKLKLTQQ